jgi:SsrA-binding protein
MGRKKHHSNGTIQNRRARFDYTLGDSLTVGMELTGAESKSLRLGHGQLRGSYVTIKDDQLWLINAAIIGTAGIPIVDTEQTRTRRLLAKRREIEQLMAAKQQGRTIIPLEIQTRGRFIKLRIAIGTGKKQYDKRETIKKRDQERYTLSQLKVAR